MHSDISMECCPYTGSQADPSANPDQQQGPANESHPELVLRVTGVPPVLVCSLW